MSLPAEDATTASLPVFDVETVLARLPADSRAQLTWAKKPIRDALARLATERLDDQLLDVTADAIWPAWWRISVEFTKAMSDRPHELVATVMQDYGTIETRLRDHLGDEDAVDTLSWIIGFLRAYVGFLATVPGYVWRSLADVRPEEVASHPETRFFIRGYVALMGSAELSRLGAAPDRAAELVDIAFLELTRFKRELERAELNLSAFPFQTTEERRQRQALYAQRLRQTLGPEDESILAGARLGDLR